MRAPATGGGGGRTVDERINVGARASAYNINGGCGTRSTIARTVFATFSGDGTSIRSNSSRRAILPVFIVRAPTAIAVYARPVFGLIARPNGSENMYARTGTTPRRPVFVTI